MLNDIADQRFLRHPRLRRQRNRLRRAGGPGELLAALATAASVAVITAILYLGMVVAFAADYCLPL